MPAVCVLTASAKAPGELGEAQQTRLQLSRVPRPLISHAPER
jgi:hypothetical protein